jgi:hypothetical protein
MARKGRTMAEMISGLNLLLRERDRLREALARLHAWALSQQEGDCIYSGDHPLARAAIALNGAPPFSALCLPSEADCATRCSCESEEKCVRRAAGVPASHTDQGEKT